MKKNFLLVLMLTCLQAYHAQAQQKSLSKKEAKEIAADINDAIAKLDNSLEQINWNAMGKLLNQTIEAVDKNTESLKLIVDNIDMDQLNEKMEKLSFKIEKTFDKETLEKLENQLKDLQNNLEKKATTKEK